MTVPDLSVVREPVPPEPPDPATASLLLWIQKLLLLALLYPPNHLIPGYNLMRWRRELISPYKHRNLDQHQARSGAVPGHHSAYYGDHHVSGTIVKFDGPMSANSVFSVNIANPFT